jgi:single-stranded-DNA-specific exonuclease
MVNKRQFCRRAAPEGEDRLPDDLHPVLRRVYRARKLLSGEELDLSLNRLIPPDRLRGMAQATALLADALARQHRILIVADFDADGATSCALAVRALRAFGAAHVDFLVPNRFEYGYGLTPEIVALARPRAPGVLITVDNGISSVEGVAAARAAGMRVLVTDHHLPGERLPDADVTVNPNQPGDTFPSKALAGVGTIFYVMLALRAHLRETGWLSKNGVPEPNLAELLDLVALGTVADVVPLDHNNRILVAQGLARIRAGRCVPGIRALLRIAGRDPARISATDLGFVVAPRLNAAGRLSDMSLGIACLLTDRDSEAEGMARQLDQLNRERREIEKDMQKSAFEIIERLYLGDRNEPGAAGQGWPACGLSDNGLPPGLCLFDESWHQGVTGLVAARVKERTHRPVIAFAPAGDDAIKGSARSVPGLHIRDALDNIAARHPDLLHKFGGHAMAAGLTLAREHFDPFREAFEAEVGRWLSDDDLQGRVYTDGELEENEFSLELAELLRAAGPWGQAFPEPVFEGRFEVLESKVVGEKHLKLAVRAGKGARTLSAIAFQAAPRGVPPDWSRVTAAFRLDVNEWQGRRSLQLVIEHLEDADAPDRMTGRTSEASRASESAAGPHFHPEKGESP